MTPEQFQTVVLPKIQGTQHLVKYLPPSSLDFFVMLSSVVGIFGGPTQGNYVAGSVFQDAYARYLTSIGEPATVLDLGWIKGAGYVEENQIASAYVASQGMQPVTLDTFFKALSYAVTKKPETPAQSQIMVGLSHTVNKRIARVGRLSFLQVRESVSSNAAAAGPAQTRSAQQVFQSCKTYGEAVDYISQRLLEKISSLMAMPLSNLRLDGSVSDYGIDSLIAIEIRNWMRQELGCNLGTFEILGSKTIADLGDLTAQRSRWLSETDFSDKPGEARKETETDSDTGSVASDESPPTSVSGSDTVSDLPSLPVPSLEATTAALLESQRLISTDEQYAKSKACIDKFISPEGKGPELQARLQSFAKKSQNWHTDVWMDTQYFELRAPVMPYTSFFGVHELREAPSVSDTAACLCMAVLEFQEKLENGTMERDLLRDAAADMDQYNNMFNACRQPHAKKDRIVRFDSSSHRHIAVMRDGHIFKLPYEHDGMRLTKAHFKAAIDVILKKELGPATAIGALTTMDRDAWAEVRHNPLD